MKKWFRVTHRWLGVAMAIQIFAWMVSGLYFAWFPIETIRGEHIAKAPVRLSADDLGGLVTPEQAWTAASGVVGMPGSLEGIELVKHDNEAWYRVSGIYSEVSWVRLVNGRTGQVMDQLDEQSAISTARASLVNSGSTVSAQLITQAESGSEYRGRNLPLWQVSFDEPEGVNVYIDPWTAQVVTRRTERWRLFDFLWMLHIMDYGDRDDFNTPLLQIAAALGVILALTGLWYWAITTRVFRRRKPRI